MKGQEQMSGKFGIRVGEALVAGGPPGTAAEPEVAIGEMDGPFGTAFANLLGNQVAGHSRVLALLNTDVMVRPATLCVSKVTVTDEKYTNILMGTVQYATAMGVLDAVRVGDIPMNKVNDLGVIVSVWLNPSIVTVKDLDHKVLFNIHRDATAKAIKKAMNNEPSIEWLLENQDKVIHKYFEKGLKGEI
jgi:formaldehyde-activating enzyme